MKKYIASVLILCAAMPAFSQARIDKEIERMERMRDVETLYTEKREPKKKKLLVTSRIFNFSNQSLYECLNRAFETERPNSVSAMKTKTQMTYSFQDGKGVSTYTLTNNNGQYVLIMKWVSSENTDNDTSLNNGTDNILIQGLKDLAQFDVENGDDYTYYNFKKGTIVINSENTDNDNFKNTIYRVCDEYGCPVENTDDNVPTDIRRQAHRQAAEARRQAAEARKQAAEARKQAAEARRQAAEARKQALAQAAEARRQAAKARKKAQEARKKVQKSRKTSNNNYTEYTDENGNNIIIYQL